MLQFMTLPVKVSADKSCLISGAPCETVAMGRGQQTLCVFVLVCPRVRFSTEPTERTLQEDLQVKLRGCGIAVLKHEKCSLFTEGKEHEDMC